MAVNRQQPSEYVPSNIEAALPSILSEIDTEIAMRICLEETLQSRIQWALSLRATLQNGRNGNNPGISPHIVQNLATDVLVNAELPSSAMFATAPTPPGPSAQPGVAPPVYRRPLPRPKPVGMRSKGNFLFVNAQNVSSAAASYPGSEPQYLLLRCPNCSRTLFSSLQGLLNHARITHSIEYGTHDACIKACAVEEPNLDLDEGIEVGLGPSGVLPGLQTLFERAVGVQLPMASVEPIVKQEAEQATTDLRDTVQVGPSTLTQTLGIHGESAALARFLGKEARRRQIRVYDEDVDVDIGTTEENGSSKKPNVWKMSFAQRNVVTADTDTLGAADPETKPEPLRESTSITEGSPASHSILDQYSSSSGSRFHFSVRVAISDRSLFIPQDKRLNSLHTHKWMVGAESPSYSLPLSCVLKSLKVTPLSGSFDGDLPVSTVERPPYTIVGTASKPFLARVELVFNSVLHPVENGNGNEQKMILEHWVDLDPLRLSSVILGEEQLVDAELDRRTEIKPAILDCPPMGSKKLWEEFQTAKTPDSTQSKDSSTSSVVHALLLEVARRYPLTAQGRERSQLESIPYKLCSSRSQFKNLVFGRQQAIKLARARAIKEAFSAALAEAQLDCPPISTTDLFLWLQENEKSSGGGSTQALPSEDAVPNSAGQKLGNEGLREWCGFCGLELSLHQSSEDAPIKQENDNRHEVLMDSKKSLGCSLYQRNLLPGLNDGDTSSRRRQELLSTGNDFKIPLFPTQMIERQLVHSVDPNLILLIQGVVKDMKLPAFQPTDSRYPIDQYGPRRSDVEANLAPHALIALALQHFVRDTVQRGLSQAMKEKAAVMQHSAVGSRRPRHAGRHPSLLTPHHIVAGNGLTGTRLLAERR